ncbi:MAG: DnaD domain protein [Chloroflexota bacterium]
MTSFDGFAKRDRLTPLPQSFFTDLLPLVDDLAELKVILYVMWAVQQREGRYRYITATEAALADDLRIALEVARPDADSTDTLMDALDRAVARGALLSEQIPDVDGEPETLYFMNTALGREAQQAVKQGRYFRGDAVEILPPRPNIYRLYEQEIGPITPMIAEGLRDLENDYPPGWLPEAVRVAAEQQAKHLKFIRAVLERWRKEGRREDEITGRHGSESNSRSAKERYGGKYADWFD